MKHLRTLIAVIPAVVFLATGCGEGIEGTLTQDLSAGETKLFGAHYNLNIIGVPKTKSADMTGNDGRRIFVGLGSDSQVSSTKINLSEGPFNVLDANGTDGTAAFQLPNPDPDNSGTTTYSVFARALGKPGGSSKTTTCLTDETGTTYSSIYSMVLTRDSGPSKFTNVSKQLLYVYYDSDGDGKVDTRSPLFYDPLADYFGQYDNSGLKRAALRFYEQIQTTVPAL
jgi:hypothetical protein